MSGAELGAKNTGELLLCRLTLIIDIILDACVNRVM